MSLPSWERGLKLRYCYDEDYCKESLPSWERGLKYRLRIPVLMVRGVAPLVGAWIEMYLNGNEDQPELVAPLVGAWIEMCS